jgi:putative FmdB family regulatory protein
MPLYEYKCENCGDVFELIQKFSDVPTAIHEKCGGKVNRLISTSALMFKGSGWYVNDYAKNKSPGAANGGKKDGDSSSDSKDSASLSKDSAAGSSSAEGSKSDSSKSDSSKSDSSKDSSKPSSTPSTTTSSTSSDKK